MTKINWHFYRYFPSGLDVTDSVISFSYMQGRQNYLDSYNGGILSVTLNNQSNIAQYFTFNTVFVLSDDTVDAGEQLFWVQSVTFNDYPGNTGMSTITVQLADVLARNGRNVVSNVSLIQNNTVDSAFALWTTVPFQIGGVFGTGAGTSNARAITYSGSMLNYFNLITTTERGLVYFISGTAMIVPRKQIGRSQSNCTFTRNATSATAIAYHSWTHTRADLNFINNVTVNPIGLTPQSALNGTNFINIGNSEQSFTTVDATTTQALGLAQYLSVSQGDPATETFSVSFMDLPQNATVTKKFLSTFYGDSIDPAESANIRIWDLVSRVPGAGSDTTTQVAIEGISVSATPDRTEFTVYLSPLTFYQFFTLDSSTLGVLDTSRLGF